jgi:hypothetical protein
VGVGGWHAPAGRACAQGTGHGAWPVRRAGWRSLSAHRLVPPASTPRPSVNSARKLFRGSLVYLPLLLVALAVHRQPNEHTDAATAEARLRLQWEAARARLATAAAAVRGVAPGAPDVRLRSVEERLGWIEQLRWQVRSKVDDIKCPSRVFADEVAQSAGAEQSSSSGGGGSRPPPGGGDSGASSSGGAERR